MSASKLNFFFIGTSPNFFYYGCLHRYISKPEHESPSYIKATKSLMTKANEGMNARKIMQKALIQGLPRDLPKQVRKSISFVNLTKQNSIIN